MKILVFSISRTYGKIGRLSCGIEWIDLKWYMIRLCSWFYSCERRSKRRIFILEVRSKINSLLLDIISQLYNQLHSLIIYHFKSIHSTPQLKPPIFPYVWDIGRYQYFLFLFLYTLLIIPEQLLRLSQLVH